MKKFSALLCVALLITFGGVYAAWTYNEGTATEPNIQPSVNISIEDVSSAAAKGAISYEGTIGISVDDENEDHKPDGSFGDGIRVIYTPATIADVPTSISVDVVITINTDKNIFYDGSEPKNIFNLTDFTDGKKTVTLSNVTSSGVLFDLNNHIAINSNIHLETSAEYANYKDALSEITISIALSEHSEHTAA